MVFHSHSYLPRATFKEKLTRLVEVFAVEPIQTDTILLPPAVFLERLHTGVIPDVNARGWPIYSLAVAVAATEQTNTIRHGFTLELNRVYLSEERDNIIQEPEEVWNRSPFIGRHGYNMAPDGQVDIAKSGYVSISLEGDYVADAHASSLGVDAAKLRSEQRSALIKILHLMAPDYAFFTNASDYELWDVGPIKKFPPLEPWQFLWSFMSFGKPTIEKFGRERLLAAPAYEILEHENIIHMQAFDFIFSYNESMIRRSKEQFRHHTQQREAMLQHLGLQLPYETIF